MRRRRKKKSRIGPLLIAFLIMFLMVGSVLTVVLNTPQSLTDLQYGALTFTVDPQTGMYLTEANDQVYRFNNLPPSAFAVNTSAAAFNLLRAAPFMILSFDPETSEENLAYIDFVRFELAALIPNLGGGVTKETEDYALPVITCANSTPQTPVIVIEEGTPGIQLDTGCVRMTGNLTTHLLAKDAFIINYFDLEVQ